MPKATMHKARIAALTAGVAALTVAAAIVATAAPVPDMAPPVSAARSAGEGNGAVKPGAIRRPGAVTLAPPTTAQCEQNDNGIACYQPGQLRTAYHLPALYA